VSRQDLFSFSLTELVSYQTYFGEKVSSSKQPSDMLTEDAGQHCCPDTSRASLRQMELCLIELWFSFHSPWGFNSKSIFYLILTNPNNFILL